MVTATITPNHTHKYLVENGGNAKCRCGQVVRFNQSDSDMRKWTKDVLVEGDVNYRDNQSALADPPAAAVVKHIPPKEFSEYHEWLGKHRAEIFEDLDTIGRKDTEARWGITHRSMGQLILGRDKASMKKAQAFKAKVSQIVPEVAKQAENMTNNMPVAPDKLETADLSVTEINQMNQILTLQNRIKRQELFITALKNLPQLEWTNDAT